MIGSFFALSGLTASGAPLGVDIGSEFIVKLASRG
jgi:hypothetical protein